MNKEKIKIPLFEDKELELFDDNIHKIIEEYSKLCLEKQEQILTQRVIIKQEEEINKYKEVLDKIKEYCEYNLCCIHDEEILKHIIELLEEIE